jgi:hypothetical protein
MEKNRLLAGVEFVALIAMLGTFRVAKARHQPASPGATPAPEAVMICSALEVKTAERVGAALVIFHQANKSDGPRLGELLRQNDGASVEFQTSDGRAHTATAFRLGTCFGRGLLVFRAGSAQVFPGEQFRLKFPKGT